MDTAKFWSMIEESRQKSGGNIDKQLEILVEDLSRLPTKSILGFERSLWAMMTRAYRADVWDSVRLVACGCSDDGFHDFQGWLIAQGQVIYEEILADPQALADRVDKIQRFNIFHGRMTSTAEEAYEQKTGELIPESEYEYREQAVLVGGPLTPEPELPAKYPRIVAKLGKCDDVDWGEVYDELHR
ncbi:MAG: DUF4240 domain-containing protein [Anaerolineae bacterium]|nr:DUF4240 domain-containing protein [Anaerolineae bacterium]